MKPLLSILTLAALLAACATNRPSEAERLALYRAHAGEPVKYFDYFGQINGWTPLGDRALTVWTRPNRAYLLELSGPCMDLDFAPAISISNQMGRVSARFDNVIVHGGGGGGSSMRFPCRIQEIRPLDVKALKAAQSELRRADAVDRKASGS
jgi:hypothetical protein